MQKSYIVKSPINFVESNFRANAGDILVHDIATHKLTVYRGGNIAKVLPQTTLGIMAFVKNKWLSEMELAPKPSVAAITEALKLSLPKLRPDPPKAVKETVIAQKEKETKKPKEEKKNGFTAEEWTPEQKRKKAQPTEVKADDLPPRLKEALAQDPDRHYNKFMDGEVPKRPPLKVELPEPIVKDETV